MIFKEKRFLNRVKNFLPKSFLTTVMFLVLSSILAAGFVWAEIKIGNPLEHENFSDLIKAIIRFLQEVAMIVTTLIVVLAGYYFVGSMGDPAKITQAKKMLLYALIGLIIILLAEGLSALITEIIKGSGTGSS